MGDIFRSRFFIITLIVIAVLTIAAMILTATGRGAFLSDTANIIVMPFQKFADILKDSFAGFSAYFTEFNKLKEENALLKSQVAALESELEDLPNIKEQNRTYETFYSIKKSHVELTSFEFAVIIQRGSGNYQSIFTVNKGSLHNIKKDMPVITEQGIVGYVSEVSYMTSKIELFIRTSNSIGAYIKRTQQTGIVEGDFPLEKEGKCKITSLSKDSDLEVGDKIYSSGYGGIYPEDLYIGKVVKVVPDALSQTMIGYIEPAVDFYGIKTVTIIREFNRNFY